MPQLQFFISKNKFTDTSKKYLNYESENNASAIHISCLRASGLIIPYHFVAIFKIYFWYNKYFRFNRLYGLLIPFFPNGSFHVFY